MERPKDDHDQRFKTMIREFFREFMELFFPAYAALLEFDLVIWLDKELFVDPPRGDKRYLDLVARVPAKSPGASQDQIILVHIEIDSNDTTTILEPRIPLYYWHLRQKYDLAVLPVVLF